MPIPCFPHQITAARNVTLIYKVTEHTKIMMVALSFLIVSKHRMKKWWLLMIRFFVEKGEESHQGDAIAISRNLGLVLTCTLWNVPARTWQRSGRGGWVTSGISYNFPSSHGDGMDSVLGVTHRNSSLAAPSWPWDHSSSATWANGAGGRTGSSWAILPWGQMLQIRVFLQPSKQEYTGRERPFINPEQKVLEFANPQEDFPCGRSSQCSATENASSCCKP